MTERVSIIAGKKPVLVVAPHGYDQDDENTTYVAETIAEQINCYAVINRGWERADNVDCMLDKADCNNVVHCHEDVVREEFLDPILRYKNRILQAHNVCHMFYVHGMANRHRQLAGDLDMDMVIGYGAGSPNSHSCDPWRKDLFMHLLLEAGLHPYQGKSGGPMSGWARNNMNQLFRKWYNDPRVQSMQVEIVHDLRSDKDIARLTAHYVAEAIKDMLDVKSYNCTEKYKAY
jgi:hypothetical protein